MVFEIFLWFCSPLQPYVWHEFYPAPAAIFHIQMVTTNKLTSWDFYNSCQGGRIFQSFQDDSTQLKKQEVLGHFLCLCSFLIGSLMLIQGCFIQTYIDLLASQASGDLVNYFFLPHIVAYHLDTSTHIYIHIHADTDLYMYLHLFICLLWCAYTHIYSHTYF